MIGIQITFSEAELSGRIQDIRTLAMRGLVDPELGTLPKQAQLLTEHCIKLTPPKTVGQGKRRVKYDVERIFHPVDPGEMRSPSVAKLVRRSDAEAWAKFTSNLGKGPMAGTRAVTPTQSLHNANRDRRGRAKRTNFVTLWKERGQLREVIKAAQARVGWAKAGWLRAYRALGGTRVSEWYMRFSHIRGIFINGMSDPVRPFIGVYNDTGWGKGGESNRVVLAAMRARERAMQSYYNATMRLASEGKPTLWQIQMQAVASTQIAA